MRSIFHQLSTSFFRFAIMNVNEFPIAKRPGEYVVFVVYMIPTLLDGNGYFFISIDAFNGVPTQLGMANNDNIETILKYIYQLTKIPDMFQSNDKVFTLVLEEYEEFSEPIHAILKGLNGNLLIDKAYHNHISIPVLKNLEDYLKQGLLKYNN
jgi:hypothetical protein